MSKSVTIIRGRVWAQRSVTWNRNVASGNVGGGPAPRHDRGHRHDDPNAGDSPDDAPMQSEWDSIEQGRMFTRQIKTC